jgi:hypothetical protein
MGHRSTRVALLAVLVSFPLASVADNDAEPRSAKARTALKKDEKAIDALRQEQGTAGHGDAPRRP